MADMKEPMLNTEASWEVAAHRTFLTDPCAWYRHPAIRIFALFLVLFMDFFTYGEDPVQDSRVHATSIGTGQIVGMLSFWYAPSMAFKLAKVGCVVVAVVLAIFIGRALRWAMIRGCKFGAFASDGGLVLSVILGFGIAAFGVDAVYNYFETAEFAAIQYLIDAHSMEFFQTVFVLKSQRYQDMGKMWQWISATLDWLAIFQIIDSVFQDRKYWPTFMPGCKKWYCEACRGKFRKYFFWVGFPLAVAATRWVMSNSGNEPGQFNWELAIFPGRGEVWRSLFAGFIVFLDLFCLAQDWEFPLFSEHHHDEADRAVIAGTDSSTLKVCGLEISAKWLQYGPLLGVMGADFAFVKGIFQYVPSLYGQYVDPNDSSLWVIRNEAELDMIYPLGTNTNKTLLERVNYTFRRSIATGECLASVPQCDGLKEDIQIHAKFYGTTWDYAGAVMAVLCLIGFLVLVRISSNTALEEETKYWKSHSTHKEKKKVSVDSTVVP